MADPAPPPAYADPPSPVQFSDEEYESSQPEDASQDASQETSEDRDDETHDDTRAPLYYIFASYLHSISTTEIYLVP